MTPNTNPMQMAWNEYRDQVRLFGTKPSNFGNLLKRAHVRFRAERQQAANNAVMAAEERAEASSVARAYRSLPRSVQVEIDGLREQLAFRQAGMLSGNHQSTIDALKAQINARLFPARTLTQEQAA